MSVRKQVYRPLPPGVPARVGLFGILGYGNIGNDASMEAMLEYLKAEHPDAVVDAMCTGADTVRRKYHIPAVCMQWQQKFKHRTPGKLAAALKLVSKVIDIYRMANWVRRHDVVVVPGMGALEASLPIGPWGFPYAMFLMSLSGKLFRTKIALVSVGAGNINQRLTRQFFTMAARLAYYRSYRDAGSREAMGRRGVDTSSDPVYPDLAFSLPVPPPDPGDPRIVCVGVMEFHGNNDDRERADTIRDSYVSAMQQFVCWLLDNGRQVRLIIGDTNGRDDEVVQGILAYMRECRPDLDQSRIIAHPVNSLADIMRAIQPAGSVVAIRFHNIVAALMVGKPTIAISYSPKHDALMTTAGVPEFCLPAREMAYHLLVDKFSELESRAVEVRSKLAQCKAINENLLKDQFSRLSAGLFPVSSASGSGEYRPTSEHARRPFARRQA